MLVHLKQWIGKIVAPIGQTASDDAKILKAVTTGTGTKTFDVTPPLTHDDVLERDEC